MASAARLEPTFKPDDNSTAPVAKSKSGCKPIYDLLDLTMTLLFISSPIQLLLPILLVLQLV